MTIEPAHQPNKVWQFESRRGMIIELRGQAYVLIYLQISSFCASRRISLFTCHSPRHGNDVHQNAVNWTNQVRVSNVRLTSCARNAFPWQVVAYPVSIRATLAL